MARPRAGPLGLPFRESIMDFSIKFPLWARISAGDGVLVLRQGGRPQELEPIAPPHPFPSADSIEWREARICGCGFSF
jgi:hypothetical protein